MPRSAMANQQVREGQRARILAAARVVLARQGAAVTIDDIAAEAGVSHGLAYRYFRSKEEILRALIEQAIQESPPSDAGRESKGTPGERLTVLISEFVESRRASPEFFQLFDQVLDDEAMPARFRKLLKQRAGALEAVLRELIVEGQASGEVASGDPDQLVAAIFACLTGLTRWAARHPQESARHFPGAEIVLRMLKP